jgi:hypothetical protein
MVRGEQSAERHAQTGKQNRERIQTAPQSRDATRNDGPIEEDKEKDGDGVSDEQPLSYSTINAAARYAVGVRSTQPVLRKRIRWSVADTDHLIKLIGPRWWKRGIVIERIVPN